MPHLREEQVAAIVREYRSGAAVPALAMRFSVTAKTIYHWLKAKKVKKRDTKGHTGKLSEAQIAEFVRAYKSGSSVALMAERLGVSARTICYWLKSRKVVTRGRWPCWTAAQIATILRLHKKGLSAPRIAKHFGVSSTTIYSWLKIKQVHVAAPPRLRKEQVTEIVRAYKSGESAPTLAARFNVSTAAIHRWLRVNEVTSRVWTKPRLVSYEALCADYLSGLTAEQVGKKHRVSTPTVCRALKLGGIAVRPPPRGPAHYAWKGGPKLNSSGYVVLSDGRLLHRVIAERLLGRQLKHWEASHHVDEDKQNNVDENIVAMPEREHSRFHTFLRHRGLSSNREILECFCRQEGPAYFRFTTVDFARWSGKLPPGMPLGQRLRKPPRKCRVKSCATVGKTIRGLCNKHYQRKRARDRGYWISGGGLRHPFTGSRFIGSRKGIPRSG